MTTNELKKWMKKNQKGSAWIASQTGFTIRTIQRLLKGQTKPSPVLAESIKKITETK